MEFSDKLKFLFELCHAEGKDLAAAMNVTPPQISKMRNGQRQMPKSRDAGLIIARFFAQRCDSTIQRDALAKAMRLAQVRNIDSEQALTDLLYQWLTGEQRSEEETSKRADDFVLRMNSVSDASNRSEVHRTLKTSGGNMIAYYGNEGKRKAASEFLQYLYKLGKAFSICILMDESSKWIVENFAYSERVYEQMVQLTKQGCVFRRIVGPLTDIDEAFESLNRWFPLYLTGKATSYYYNRLRDNLNRITIFAVPDVAAMFSFSVGEASAKDSVTFFTTDVQTVNSMAAQFESYMALCEPAMRSYSVESSAKKMHNCILEYESCKANCIQANNCLPFITLPWEIATSLEGESQEAKKDFLTVFAQRYKVFQTNLEKYDFIDIIRLSKADDVLDGIVPIPAAHIVCGKVQYYKPEEYLRHLKAVLFFLGHKPHYHVIVRGWDEPDAAIVYVKEGCTAILTKASIPFVIFEVMQHHLVNAFNEYLRRMLPSTQKELKDKRASVAAINELIDELETRMGLR